MKKQIVIISLFLNGFIFAQDNRKLEGQIRDQISEIEDLIKFSKFRMEISPTSVPDFNPQEKRFFEEAKLNFDQNIQPKLSDFFNSQKVTYSALYPYSVIAFDFDSYNLQQLLGKGNTYFMNNRDKMPVFQPVSVEYADGTSEDIQNKVITINKVMDKYTKIVKENGKDAEYVDVTNASKIEQYLWEEYHRTSQQKIILEQSKIIKKINYQVQFPMEETKVFYISKQGENIDTPFGKIELLAISGNEIQFQVPSVIKENIEVKAFYKDGRILKYSGSNSFTAFSVDKTDALESYLKVLEKAEKMVKSSKINSEQNLQKYLTENAPEALKELDKKKSVTQVMMKFSGPIEKVAFIVPVSESQQKTFQGSADLAYSENEKDYITAQDFETKKIGILGKNGNWLVKPQFDDHFRMINRNYFTDQIDDRENIYHFNPKTSELKKVNYRFDDYEIYQNKYVKIEPRVNGKNGLADVETGKIVIPMEYDFLNWADEKFWHLKKDGKEGVLDVDLKIIMPIVFDKLAIENGYIFEKKEGYSTRINAYNSQGKNLTNGKFSEIKGSFSDGLLLVSKDNDPRTGYADNHYYYIDELCNIKIDATAKNYQNPEAFSAGMAVVQNKDGDYGYINTKGELAIPFQYKYARYFYPTSQLALVKLNDNTNVLIDKKGKVIKKLPGDFIESKFHKKDRSSRILMSDRKSFNEYGEELEYKMGDYW